MDEFTSEGTTDRQRRKRRVPVAIGLVAAGAVAGGVLAGTLSASAAGTTSTGTSSSSSYGSAPTNPGPGGASPVRSDEKALNATDTAEVRAAALKAVPGGTVIRIETDAGDATYEAHMKKADGTLVTVKLNASFVVTAVEAGMGKGDPMSGGPGHGMGQPPAQSGSGTAG